MKKMEEERQMKKKEKAYSRALASTFIVLFLLSISAVASASPEQNQRTVAPPEITSGAGDLSDDQILSDELSTGNDKATESIQAAAPKIIEKRITTNAAEQYAPVIDGNKVAWEDNRNGNLDIYIYDHSTKKEISSLNT